MKKDVLIIAHFSDDLDKKGNGRFNYLANTLADIDVDVELVTSSFSHNKKKARDKNSANSTSYKVTFIEEPAYKKNVSLKRFFSHYAMASNLKKYLKSRKKPNVIYCSIPSLDVASTAAKYAKENNIKFVIDVQDLWPEAFQMVFNVPVISDIMFYPMKKKADYVYKVADEIVAVSETYKNRALKVNTKVQEGKVVYLGTELSKFDEAFFNNKCQEKPDNEVWVAYAGTLGHSYDLTSVFDALEILKNKGHKNLKFVVMGDGPLKKEFEKYAQEKQINTRFTGRLPYEEMVGMLGECDIAVNPIKAGSAGSVINKVGDYAGAGLPVLNTQESPEYRELLDKYQAGLNCMNGDAVDLAEKLLFLLDNPLKREQMAKNNRCLAEEKFDRKRTYSEILKIIDFDKSIKSKSKGDN